MIKTYLFLTLAFNSFFCHAQEKSLMDVIKVTFNSEVAHDKIFFEHKGIEEKPFVLPNGVYAFIVMPNDAFLKYYPSVGSALSLSHGTYGWIGTIPYIKNLNESIMVSSINAIQADANVEQFIVFDTISISNKKAEISFHSTTLRRRAPSPEKYFQFEFSLKCKKKKWIITASKVKEIKCCDFRFDD